MLYARGVYSAERYPTNVVMLMHGLKIVVAIIAVVVVVVVVIVEVVVVGTSKQPTEPTLGW